jgi:hypothetical protein
MGTLVRMKPKPHEEMKVGKPTKKARKKRATKTARWGAPGAVTGILSARG